MKSTDEHIALAKEAVAADSLKTWDELSDMERNWWINRTESVLRGKIRRAKERKDAATRWKEFERRLASTMKLAELTKICTEFAAECGIDDPQDVTIEGGYFYEYDDIYEDIVISCSRPITDAEAIEEDREKEKNANAEKDARRRQYEKLKREFER